MSGHADTIRYMIARHEHDGAGFLRPHELVALQALFAELVKQADRIAWLEGEVAGWRIKLAECIEDAERYCDALEKIAATDGGEWYARSIARAALDGTPSKLAECEERQR